LAEIPRGSIAHGLSYFMLRLLGFVMGVMPYRISQKIGSFLGRVVAVFDRRHIRRAAENIKACLGVAEEEARRIAIASYRHVGMVAAEFFQMARMASSDDFRRHVVLDAAAEFRKHFEKGRGIVAPTGHIGNWEYCGQMTAVEGMPPGSIIKAFKNPFVDAYVDRIRRRWGLVPVEKSKRGVVEAVRRVRSGMVMAIMSDQHADEGIAATLFGRPCKTVDTAARIALKTGAPMVPVTSYRREDGKHVLVIWPEITPPHGVAEDEAARIMTQEMNHVFEKAIKAHPEQWLWAQRRYRENPSAITPPSTNSAEPA
jgi:KDO2-lipid IV(A) lauroyltransferase